MEMNRNKDTQSQDNDPINIIDDLLGQIESYDEDPKNVTPDTLNEMRDKLITLRDQIGGEEQDEESTDAEGENMLSSMVKKSKKGMGMALALIALSLGVNLLYSGTNRPKNGLSSFISDPGIYVSQDVYYSSVTCSATFGTILSTWAVTADRIEVSSAGGAGSWFDLWDSRGSTNPATGARRIAGPFPADATGIHWLGTSIGSSTLLNVESNNGKKPCFNFWYFEK